MSGTVIKEFLVGLGFQVDEAGLSKFDEGISSASINIAAFGVASVAAAGAVIAFVGSVADQLDAVGDVADRIGTTAEELMRLQYVATLSGSSADAAASSMESLGRIAGEAAQGIGRGAKVFADLGISAKDATGKLKPTTQLLADVGDKIKDLSRQEQVAVLSKLGIDPSMIGAITGGMQELASEFDELYKAAGVDLNKAAEASGTFNDALDRLGMTFDAVKTAVAVKFMPQIARGIDTVRQFLVQNLPKIIGAVQPIFGLILNIAESFITLAARVASGIGVILGWFVKMNDATNGWAAYLLAAAAAWKYLNLSFLMTPIGMLIALAAVVALLIDDFLTFKEGGDSLIDWGSTFGIVMQGVTSVLAGLVIGLTALKVATLAQATATMIVTKAKAAWAATTAFANGVMTTAKLVMAGFNAVMYANPIGLVIAAIAGLIAIGYLLITNWQAVKDWFIGLWSWFAGEFPGIAGFITDAFSGAAASVLEIFEGVKTWFAGFIDYISAGFDKVKNIAGIVSNFFGGNGAKNAGQTIGPNKNSPPLTPNPQTAAAVTKGNQNVNQQTQIVVQGGGNADATARAVAGQQNRVNADMARNMRGSAR